MKILIIQLRQLGDIVLSSLIARVAKENLRVSEVGFATYDFGVEILQNNPFIDEIYPVGRDFTSKVSFLRRIWRRYDAVIDVQRTGTTRYLSLFSGAKMKVAFRKKFTDRLFYNRLVSLQKTGYSAWDRLVLLKALGLKEVPKLLPEVYLKDEEILKAKSFLKTLGLKEGKFFVVVPTSRKKAYAEENFGILAKLIKERTALTPLIAYAPKEKDRARKCHEESGGVLLEKPLRIRELAAVMKLSSFVLGNDSFAAHLSVAVRKKTLVVLGPHSGWFPDADFVFKVSKGLSCQPCDAWKKCPYGLKCYSDFSPEEVFKKFEEVGAWK